VFDPETGGTANFDFPLGSQLKECSNNTIVWLPPGKFPYRYPADCFKVTNDVNVWKEAVRDWHARNPDVGKAYKPPVSEMGEVGVVACP
jgi:hypothetical protein